MTLPPNCTCLASLITLTGQGSCRVQMCTAAAALLPAEAHMLLSRQSMLDSRWAPPSVAARPLRAGL